MEAGEFGALDGASAEESRELVLGHAGYFLTGHGEEIGARQEFRDCGHGRSRIVGADVGAYIAAVDSVCSCAVSGECSPVLDGKI